MWGISLVKQWGSNIKILSKKIGTQTTSTLWTQSGFLELLPNTIEFARRLIIQLISTATYCCGINFVSVFMFRFTKSSTFILGIHQWNHSSTNNPVLKKLYKVFSFSPKILLIETFTSCSLDFEILNASWTLESKLDLDKFRNKWSK